MLCSASPLNFYRTALNFAVEYNNVALQGNLRIRRYQIEQIEAALSDYSELSEKLGKHSHQEQWLHVGAELAASQLERTLGYWNALSNVVGQNQLELAGVFQSGAVELPDGLKQKIDPIPSTIPMPVGAVFKKAMPQPMPSIFANGAQYASRGKHREDRAQPAQRQ